jgi:hypothetical protein
MKDMLKGRMRRISGIERGVLSFGSSGRPRGVSGRFTKSRDVAVDNFWYELPLCCRGKSGKSS